MADQSRQVKVARKQAKRTMKHWVAVVLFGAIIIVFALWGVNPARMGEASSGGVAAMVNDTSISLAEYRTHAQSLEQRTRQQFEQFPEAQRKMLLQRQEQQVRRQALEELIMGEVVYQAAESRGILAPDTEVREYILQIPYLQENGRFVKERYRLFLQNMNLSTEDFEREIRKEIVAQKLQDLFLGAAAPTREELKRNRELTDHKLSVRYVQLNKDDLDKLGFISDQDVAAFVAGNKAEIESYYKNNSVDFSKPEKAQARHILIRIDDQRPEADALKLAKEIRGKLTVQNFSKMAAQYSDDPGSKQKGGDVGEVTRGRMVAEFENAVFSAKPGVISEPVKTSFGYHLILVDKKTEGGVQPLAEVQTQIARKLLMRTKESEVLAKTKAVLQKGDRKELEALIKRAGLKWVDSGEFDLSSSVIPKLGDSQPVVQAILKNGSKPGLVPEVVTGEGFFLLVDLLSVKKQPDVPANVEGLERMVAMRRSADSIQVWSKETEAKATIQRNPRLFQ